MGKFWGVGTGKEGWGRQPLVSTLGVGRHRVFGMAERLHAGMKPAKEAQAQGCLDPFCWAYGEVGMSCHCTRLPMAWRGQAFMNHSLCSMCEDGQVSGPLLARWLRYKGPKFWLKAYPKLLGQTL